MGIPLPPVPTPGQATDARYIQRLTEEINACPDCSQLATLQQEIMLRYTKQLQEVLDEIAVLEILVEIPSDLGELISWISNFISSKISGPYGKLLTKYAELVPAYAQLANAVINKMSNLQCVLNPAVFIDMATNLASWAVATTSAAIVETAVNNVKVYSISTTGIAGVATMTKSAAGLASKFTANVGAFTPKLGAGGEGLNLDFTGTGAKSAFRLDSEGILANVAGTYERVYTGNMNSPDLLKTLKFEIDQSVPEASIASIYLDGAKIVDEIPATSSIGTFTENASIKLEGLTTPALGASISSISLINGFQR